MKKKKMNTSILVEGDEIAKSFEKNHEAWESVSQEEQDELRKRLRPSREKRISIRISTEVLHKIQEIADAEGMPYQTLINSHLHKLATAKSDFDALEKKVKFLSEEITEIKRKIA